MRASINLGMTAGFMLGAVVAWTGVRLLAFESDGTMAGFAAIAIAVVWWSGVIRLAHAAHRRESQRSPR